MGITWNRCSSRGWRGGIRCIVLGNDATNQTRHKESYENESHISEKCVRLKDY